MKSGSITLKLLALVAGAFFISAIGVVMVARTQLKLVIDRSQNAMYEEKVEAIWQALDRVDQRLQKTGLVEAYIEDFQESIITELRGIHYGETDLQIYPVIIDGDARIVMHPVLPAGVDPLQQTDFSWQRFQGEADNFTGEYQGTMKWYTFKRFAPWDWIIAYTVPLEIKYHDVHVFIATLINIMVAVTILVLVIFSFALTRFTKPIIRLTHSAAEIAGGNLDQKISGGRDEVGTLARSFNNMRNAIRQQIADLHHEIDERRQAEKRLQQNEENLRTTLNSIGDAVIATDTAGHIVRMNPVAEQLLGWSFKEVRGKPLKSFFHIINSKTRATLEDPVEHVLSSGSTVELESHTLLISRDGTEYRIADSGAPIRTDTGEAIGVVLVFRDITQEYALQAQLQQSQKMDAIGQLAGGVAHDFNNMLGGIMGAAEMLADYLVEEPQASKLHGLILSATDRAAGLTEKLLAFSRKKPADYVSIDIHKSITDTVALLKSTIDPRIALEVDLTAEESQVIGDSSQLENAILNMGINASHAMPDGGTLFIATRTLDLDPAYCNASTFDLAPGPHLEIEVRDTGCGIAPDVLPRIFEPFFTTKETGKGTGLGLSVVFGTVKQHHGSITAYSEPGKGTCFHILLPLAAKEKPQSVSDTRKMMIPGEGNILVVDDESVMRLTAQAILESLGYNVTLAENGREALERFKQSPDAFDLVILDMIMPEMNGRDCFAALRKINPGIRIVLSSGFSREEDLKQMREQGLCGYIRKPYRSVALSQIVHKAMHS